MVLLHVCLLEYTYMRNVKLIIITVVWTCINYEKCFFVMHWAELCLCTPNGWHVLSLTTLPRFLFSRSTFLQDSQRIAEIQPDSQNLHEIQTSVTESPGQDPGSSSIAESNNKNVSREDIELVRHPAISGTKCYECTNFKKFCNSSLLFAFTCRSKIW